VAKRTVMLQLFPTATRDPQSEMKSNPIPWICKAAMFRSALPVLEIVIVSDRTSLPCRSRGSGLISFLIVDRA